MRWIVVLTILASVVSGRELGLGLRGDDDPILHQPVDTRTAPPPKSILKQPGSGSSDRPKKKVDFPHSEPTEIRNKRYRDNLREAANDEKLKNVLNAIDDEQQKEKIEKHLAQGRTGSANSVIRSLNDMKKGDGPRIPELKKDTKRYNEGIAEERKATRNNPVARKKLRDKSAAYQNVGSQPEEAQKVAAALANEVKEMRKEKKLTDRNNEEATVDDADVKAYKEKIRAEKAAKGGLDKSFNKLAQLPKGNDYKAVKNRRKLTEKVLRKNLKMNQGEILGDRAPTSSQPLTDDEVKTLTAKLEKLKLKETSMGSTKKAMRKQMQGRSKEEKRQFKEEHRNNKREALKTLIDQKQNKPQSEDAGKQQRRKQKLAKLNARLTKLDKKIDKKKAKKAKRAKKMNTSN